MNLILYCGPAVTMLGAYIFLEGNGGWPWGALTFGLGLLSAMWAGIISHIKSETKNQINEATKPLSQEIAGLRADVAGMKEAIETLKG